mmetsp:Transcript_6212/g.9134  ORF Transcript_6212/g.9134 Transcript_6212/m.9134 type:complete len:957 (-) Transcript_6212:56-2926(-)|eukprot:CAMPEP_0194250878 /NCGR_PEP_ID=MMETSP0158-20130606/24093_1 /TAXON_ID=33649 /ORGANISM="Thalassionema nitzschioides, Strain L26-B" /LENGTH=956 /DNA_ID=CAMNT_0038987825 /DNA_START=65 /DNA_END=2935 /DNA_ORIENTATION=+
MNEKFGAVPLPAGKVRILYDPTSVTGEAQQPQAQQVAVFDAKPNDDCVNGSLLDVNEHFVVYAVKNGLIRVLHRQSTVRSLLRAHEGRKVTDISFFQSGDVLGTVGGNVIIWRVFERAQEIVAEKLLEIPDTLPSVSRIIWHPFNPNQFWLIHRNKHNTNVATLVETTRITTVAHPTEPHAVCSLHSSDVIMEGAVQLCSANLTDLGWSGRDTRHVITSHEDGCIKLWDLKTDVAATQDGIVPAFCKETIQEDEPVTSCMFLPHDNVSTNYGSLPESTITTSFCTASRRNSRITLWSPFEEGKVPSKLQVFEMDEQNPSYNLGCCFGQFVLDGDPPAFFFMLSDRTSGRMYALSLKSIWGKNEPKRPFVEGFDYVVPFMTKYPTYSWSIRATAAENLEEDTPAGGLDFDMRFYAMQSKMVQRMVVSHYMCLPPTKSWDAGVLGVRMEPLSGPCGDLIPDNEYEEDYELDDEEDDDGEDVDAPYSLPQPDTGNNNPFTNWLGAIAAKSTTSNAHKSDTDPNAPPPAPPSTPAIGAATSVPPGLFTELPPIPGMSTNGDGSGLLSPLELLSSNSKLGVEEQSPENPLDSTLRKKNNKSPKGRGASPKPKGKDKKGTNFPPGPVPSADGKIAILKRENVAPPENSSITVSSHDALPGFHDSNDSFKKDISTEIERAVRSEMKQTILPELNKKITTTVEQCMMKSMQSAIDRFTNKNANTQTERIISAVTSSIEDPLKEAFTDSMKKMLIPAFEAASREMFSQVSSAVEAKISSPKVDDSLNTKIDALTTMVQALSSEVAALRKSSNVNVPPPPPVQVNEMQRMRTEILGALQMRQYEIAFTKALSVSSTEMAVFVCREANIKDVLGGDSPALTQPILLCIMQQLGVALASPSDSDLETVLAWLQEIALCVDPSDQAIQRHVSSVLQQLHANINAKMQQGNPALKRPLQMLLQVVRGMQR